MEGKNTLFASLKASEQQQNPDIKEKSRERLSWGLIKDQWGGLINM